MKSFVTRGLCTVFIIFLIFSSGVYAQYDNKNTAELKTEAARNFNAGNYSDALNQYRSLLKRYPRDALFSYYCGISLLNMDKDLAGAIGYLEYASSKATVPYQVSYYLGEAYTRNYQFSQAKKAYTQFYEVASKTEAKELMPARLAEMSENALVLTKSYNTVEILSSSLFTFTDSAYIRQVKTPGGILSPKPSELLPSSEGLKDFTNMMFIPRNNEKGEILFYSGQSKIKKRGNEIFMTRVGNGKKFGESVPVDGVNTDYDEILPYYDPIGKDLYFASKGHNSMGGFDIFKSHYDIERNTWTPPANLGFPINSPSNEFLLIPGTDLGNIMLITDRQGLDSMITAYLLRIHEPRKQMAVADPAELKKIGKFGGIEAITDMVDMSSDDLLSNETIHPEKKPAVLPVDRPKQGSVSTKMPAEYNKYLQQALDMQFRADSLARIAREGRIQVKSIPEPDKRWEIQKNIISWEKQSAAYQAKADEYYLKVKQMENGTPETKKIPEAIVKDTVVNDITVYNYKPSGADPSEPETKTEPVVFPAPATNKPVEGEPGEVIAPVKETVKPILRFVVLDKSPYSGNNPFPEDVSLPKGPYYKIQLAVLGKEPEWDAFGGLSPVTYENVEGKSLKKYYAGKFEYYESAKVALEEVRRKGFPEAFIVGWFDGQKLAVNKVMELEKR